MQRKRSMLVARRSQIAKALEGSGDLTKPITLRCSCQHEPRQSENYALVMFQLIANAMNRFNHRSLTLDIDFVTNSFDIGSHCV